jgi:apolipoprotein N-acyltransferase
MMAGLGALALWMAFPPLDWWPLAWLAPVPWVWLVRRGQLAGRRPYAVLTLAGFAFWMGVLQWLRLPHPATSIGWVALSFYFAFYLPVFVGLSRVAVHRLHVPLILAAPVVWSGLELARGHLLSGMSMASLAHTQYRWVELIQVSDLAGEYGVSFVVMCVAAALARMLPCDGRPWAIWPLVPAVGVLAAVLGYGYLRTSDESTSPGPNVALIQGSVDIQLQDDPGLRERIFRQYCELSEEAVRKYRHVDLVVWPESMFPWPLISFDRDAAKPPWLEGSEAEFRKQLPAWAEQGPSAMARLAEQYGAPLLLGLESRHFGATAERCYVSAAYVGRDGKLLGRFDKIHLVMFGEYMPLVDHLPWLQHLTPLSGNATPGDKFAAFDVGGVCVAPSICYESVLSHVIRGQVNALTAEGKEPAVLINLTNDGWFWGSSELDLHLACGVFRAVECRKPFLIAANTGFSAWIDGDGRIRRQGPRRRTDTLLAEVRLDHRGSWYLRHGDWFAGICLLACVAFGSASYCPGVPARTRLHKSSSSSNAART